jgi:hypothetical protein
MLRKFGFVVATAAALTAAASSHASAQQYEFTLNNQSGLYLTLLVDGARHCATPPGDRCTTLVSRGVHNVTADGGNGRTANRQVNVDGPKTWTITPPPRR